MTKPVIDVVKGTGVAASARKGTCIVKTDLGGLFSSFWLKSAQINCLIEEAPAPAKNRSQDIDVKFEASDWNGDLVPTATGLQYVESSDGVVALVTLNQGDQRGLFFTTELWSHFIGLLVQYRAQL